MISSEILDMIDEISSSTTDSSYLVMESYFSYIEKEVNIYTESSNAGSVGSKIINTLKTLLKSIIGFFSKMIEKIKGLFIKQNKKHAINDIASTVVSDDDVVSESAVIQEGTQHGQDYLTSHNRTSESFGENIYVSLKNQDTVTIDFLTSEQLNRPEIKNKDMKNTSKNFGNGISTRMLFIIANVNYLKEFKNEFDRLVTSLKSGNLTEETINTVHDKLMDIDDAIGKNGQEKVFKEKYLDSNGTFSFKITDLTLIQQIFTDITEKSNSIAYDINSKFSEKAIELFNYITHFLLRLQMSFQSFSNSLEFDIKFISPKYRNKIKDPEKLGKFVSACIKNGIPPKYIIYNTWLISNKVLKGDDKHYDPVTGQSRYVMFPEDKSIVYKIAMSGFGTTSSNNETMISKMVSNNPRLKDYFAVILDNYSDGAVVKQERVIDNYKKLRGTEQSNLAGKAYKEALSRSDSSYDTNKDFDILQREMGVSNPIKMIDLHASNYVFDSNRNHMVLLDYGYLSKSVKSGVFDKDTKEYDILKRNRDNDILLKDGKISKEVYNKNKAEIDKDAAEAAYVSDEEITRFLSNIKDHSYGELCKFYDKLENYNKRVHDAAYHGKKTSSIADVMYYIEERIHEMEEAADNEHRSSEDGSQSGSSSISWS